MSLSKSAAPPNLKLQSFLYHVKCTPVYTVHYFQVICMPEANDKRIAGEHKILKVICMASAAYNLHGTKNFEVVWRAADLGVFGSAVQRTWNGLYLAVFFTYK